MPSVTVIIPMYDAARFVRGAWNSLLAQTAGDFEAIFVDDCSNDDSAAVAAAFCASDSRARLIRMDANGGPGRARNAGIDAATTEWVTVLDADDTYEPTRLERLRGEGVRLGADIVVDNVLILEPRTMRRLRTLAPEGGPARILTASDYLRNVQSGRSPSDWGFLKPFVRRAFLNQQNLRYRPDLRAGEDVQFMMEALLAGARLVLVPEPLYLYTSQYSHGTGLVSSSTRTVNNYPMLLDASRRIRLAARGAPAEVRRLLSSREESLRELNLVTEFRAALRSRDTARMVSCLMQPVRLARGVHAWRTRHRQIRSIERDYAARLAGSAGQDA